MRRWNLDQLVAYAGVMGVGTTLDVLFTTLLRHTPGVPLLLAVGTGFLTNVSSGYFFSKRFVFLNTRTHPSVSRRRYALLVALNVAIAIVGVAHLVSLGLPYLAGRLLASAILIPTNYLVMRHWVFQAA
jgi:putative flippase GtrA